MNIDTSQSSINHSSRNGMPVTMLVIHNTEGTAKSDVPILLGHTAREVSVHYYITRDGAIHQFVPENLAAWHAGTSSWLGHGSTYIQEHSIGIELENTNSRFNTSQEYPPVQYNALLELSRDIVRKYNIERVNVVRHKDIAPGRKSDPAGFDWEHFVNDLFSSTGTDPKNDVPIHTDTNNPPDAPYPGVMQPKNDISINPEDIAKTAAQTAVSEVAANFWGSFVRGWFGFLDGLKH